MRGSLVKRGKNRWALVLDLGYIADPATGTRKRKQKWISFAGTKKEAGDKLTELVRATNRHEFVEPAKTTLLEWLRAWLEKAVKPPMRRPETYRVYKSVIEGHIAKHDIASMPLQRVRTVDLENYYGTLKAEPSTVSVHHAVLHRALKTASRDRLIVSNPAADVEHRPRPSKDLSLGARRHCWSALEVRRFLDAAKDASTQLAAFHFLAVDTGARKSELHALRWEDVNLDTGNVTFHHQLDKAGAEPIFGPTKTGRTRVVTIGPETVSKLRTHKAAQAALKLKNRTTYRDFGLVFAREHEDLQTPDSILGQPLKTLSESRFRSLAKAAGIPVIRFHGVRHTTATLALQAGVPVHVVAARLGHAQPSMTLSTYAHALPDAQRDAADRLGAVLHGTARSS